MPSTTTRLALPYPVAGDTVDVPRDVLALANKLDVVVPQVPPQVTALPGSPVDGQEVYYRAPSPQPVTWHLRFAADWHAGDGYGWVAVGGQPIAVEYGAASTRASTAYGPLLDGDIPAITVPLAGYYNISFGAYIRVNVAGATAFVVPRGSVGAIHVDANAAQYDSPTINYGAAVARQLSAKLLTAGEALSLYYRASVNTVTGNGRWLSIVPLRLKAT